MQNLLYLPVNSWNFNTILATESISPGDFYSKRSFGVKMFSDLPSNPAGQVLFLYSFLPEDFIEEEDAFVFYLGFSSDYFPDLEVIKEVDGKKLFSYGATIYLNFTYPIFIFKDIHYKEQAIARSLGSLETKCLEKYQYRFLLFEDLGMQPTKSPFDLQFLEVKSNYDLKIDEQVNFFKGLVYCHYIATILQKSGDELALQNSTKGVRNAWASFISGLAYTKEDKKNKKTSNQQVQNPALELLSVAINKLIAQIQSFSPSIGIKEKTKILLRARSINEEEEEILHSFLAKLPELNQLLSKIAEKNLPTLDSELRNILEEIRRTARIYTYPNELTARIYERLSVKLNKTLGQALAEFEKAPKTSVQKSERYSKYALVENKISTLAPLELDIKESQLHIHIINTLFEKNKGTIQEVSTEHLRTIITNVGNESKELFGEESSERLWMVNFYHFFTGKALTFDASKVPSVILSNFCAFIMNHKSIEGLVNFCEKQVIQEYRYALEYWGAFNGFAGIAKIYTRGLFNNANIINQIDGTLRIGLANTLPVLKEIPFADILEPELFSIRNKPREIVFEDLWKPIEDVSELRPYRQWIESCIKYCIATTRLEYDTQTAEGFLRRELEIELFSKPRPKGFKIREVEKVVSLVNFELLNTLRNQAQKQISNS